MENLLAIFNKIQQVSPLPFFSQETVIVQNAGMQHWLNMSVAKTRGISMNIDYALPAQYLWKLLKSLASEDNALDQSPYSREVLTWRIYQLMADKRVINEPVFNHVNQYWQNETSLEQGLFKRYQLAQKLADLYEQYLIFRPEWIDAWCSGDYKLETVLFNQCSNSIPLDATDIQWQGQLWQMLHQHISYNPVVMMQDAIENLEHKQDFLPKRLSLFAINAMAPMWLNFLEKIGQYTQIHFYHLNPCFDYWGDLITEKTAIKRLNQWTKDIDVSMNADIEVVSNNEEVGNPLLANLGQQGREFIALLQSISTIDVEAYEQLVVEEGKVSDSVLKHVQQDILTLVDRRKSPVLKIDESIIITSCHSALREVQALHDWLLHQFNDDSNLTPKDVLVMCPQIEDYAPYVNAVFARGWQDIDEGIPPLPCSIADRNSKDSDPIVAGFMELLSLPDSRFQVTHILGLLRLPAIQEKLDIGINEVDIIATWLDKAAIHWGLNDEHKNTHLESESLNSQYTWQHGFSRLLRGFAYSDHDQVVDQQLLIGHVEGQAGELLGKMMLFIEQLQTYLAKLSKTRTVSQWQLLLSEMLTQSFAVTNEYSIDIIVKAITALGEYTTQAHLAEELPLTIVKDFLSSHFSEPDTSRQFMVGQVTFCSMLPMRSIPFKVIAVLGLNDGQYPRQRQPLAFDLIANTAPQLGDRSRRGDDRYLFLEAIISARQALYLSFQGRSIKTNASQQPSIVLNELFDYLTQGYGWNFTSGANSQLRQTPMQPFSEHNYIIESKDSHNDNIATNPYPSFDAKWLTLVDDTPITEYILPATNQTANAATINTDYSSDELIKFYQHPAKEYAKKILDLNFDDYDTRLSDDEPFVADGLATYQLREQLLDAYVQNDDSEKQVEDVIETAILSGKYSDTPVTDLSIESWRHDSEEFSNLITNCFNPPVIGESISVSLAFTDEKQIVWHSLLPITDGCVLCYRSSTPKFKDFLTLFLHQISLQLAHLEGLLSNVSTVQGAYFNTKSQKIVRYQVSEIQDPLCVLEQLVNTFEVGQSQPLLLNGALVDKVLTSKNFTDNALKKFWSGDQNTLGFGRDHYVQYFWQTCPPLDEIEAPISELFQVVYDHVVRAK